MRGSALTDNEAKSRAFTALRCRPPRCSPRHPIKKLASVGDEGSGVESCAETDRKMHATSIAGVMTSLLAVPWDGGNKSWAGQQNRERFMQRNNQFFFIVSSCFH